MTTATRTVNARYEKHKQLNIPTKKNIKLQIHISNVCYNKAKYELETKITKKNKHYHFLTKFHRNTKIHFKT